MQGHRLANLGLVHKFMKERSINEDPNFNSNIKKVIGEMRLKHKIIHDTPVILGEHRGEAFIGKGEANYINTIHRLINKANKGYGFNNKVAPGAYIGKSRNLGVAAHEIGHAQQAERLERLLGKKLQYVGKAPGFVARFITNKPLLSAALLTTGITKNEKRKKEIGYGTSALAIPMLTSEFGASARAYRAIKKSVGKAEARKALKTLTPAFGTYAAVSSLPALLAYLQTHHKSRPKK